MNKMYAYDIESYPNYFCAVFFDLDTQVYKTYYNDKDLLNDIILNPQVTLIGWNNLSYDDILLKYLQNCAIPISTGFFQGNQEDATESSINQLSNEIIQLGWDSTRVKELRWQVPEFKSIDVKAVLDPMPSLKKVEIRMQFHNVQDLPLPPDTILTEQQKKDITTYCHNDVEATVETFKNHALDHIELREWLADSFKLDKERLKSLSEAKTAEYILSNVALRGTTKKTWQIREQLDKEPVEEVHLSSCIPPWVKFQTPDLKNLLQELKETTLEVNPETGYADGKPIKHKIKIGERSYQMGIGGLHSIDEPYIWRPDEGYKLIDADVTSYYPSILLRDDLYPRGYGYNWIDTYRHIYNTRLKAKSEERITESNALKIVLNATFGKLGSHFSTFYDPRLLLRVTLTGQLGLLMLIERYAQEQIEVLSANTDGVLIKVHNNNFEKFGKQNLEWEQETKFNLEYNEYVKYARRDVNNYTALTTNNKTKSKGCFNAPDLKHDVQSPVVQKMAKEYLLYGTELTDYLEDNSSDLTIYDFLFSFTGTRVYKIYLNDIELSKSNRWYVSAKPLDNKLVKVGGKLQNTISIPNGANIVLCNKIESLELPKDLDMSYYIAAANKLIVSCEE